MTATSKWSDANEAELLEELRAEEFPPRQWGDFLHVLDEEARRAIRRGNRKIPPIELSEADEDDVVQEFLYKKQLCGRDGTLVGDFDAKGGRRFASYLCAYAAPREARNHLRRQGPRALPLAERDHAAAADDGSSSSDESPRPPPFDLRFRSFRRVTNPHRVLGSHLWKRLDWGQPPHPPLYDDLVETLNKTEKVEGLESRLETRLRELAGEEEEAQVTLDKVRVDIVKNSTRGADDPDFRERERKLARRREKIERRIDKLYLRQFLPLLRKDIAALLGVSDDNAWQLLHRARAKLPKLIETTGDLGEALEVFARHRIGRDDDAEENE